MWDGYRNLPCQKSLELFLVERGFTIKVKHTSGHADAETLRCLITKLNPKQIIPFHSIWPERFKKFSDKVLIVKEGEIIRFNSTVCFL